ncbi:MAG: hypothetical protein Q9218_006522 [Villophora microphyllina]
MSPSANLDPAPFVEFIETLRTPKKDASEGSVHDGTQNGSQPESIRGGDAAGHHDDADATPTPSPAKKALDTSKMFLVKALHPSGQAGFNAESEDPFATPKQSPTSATAANSPSSPGEFAANTLLSESDNEADLLGDEDPVSEKGSDNHSVTHKDSAGDGDTVKPGMINDENNLLLDEPTTRESPGLRPYSPAVFADGYQAELKPAAGTEEKAFSDIDEKSVPEGKRSGSLLSDGFAFIQGLVNLPAKSYRRMVKNPDEIQVEGDDAEAGVDEWGVAESDDSVKAEGDADDSGDAWATARQEELIQPATAASDENLNDEFKTPGSKPSADSAKSSLKSANLSTGTIGTTSTPSPPTTRPNRFDDARAAYLANQAAKEANALIPAPLFHSSKATGPKIAHFITGSLPQGFVRHARVYQPKELYEIGRKFRDAVLGTLVTNEGFLDKKVVIAMVGCGEGGVKGIGDVVGEYGLGRGREKEI